MIKVKYCSECKYSAPEEGSAWNNKCYNPYVIAKNSWALAANGKNGKHYGKSCTDERRKVGLFDSLPCGLKGKLWEAK